MFSYLGLALLVVDRSEIRFKLFGVHISVSVLVDGIEPRFVFVLVEAEVRSLFNQLVEEGSKLFRAKSHVVVDVESLVY